MKYYWSYFKLTFITHLQYRKSAAAGIFTQLFFGFVTMAVYLAFYSSGSARPMRQSDLITYVWLTQAFFAFVYPFLRDKDIINKIKDGGVAYELARPKKIYFIWFAKMLGSRLAMGLLRAPIVLLVAFLLPGKYGLSLPISFNALILFVIALILGATLITALSLLWHIIIMFTLDEKGISNIFMVFTDLLSGGIIPIPFMPAILITISNYLPFRYIADLPFRLYSGAIPFNDALIGVFVQIVWLLIVLLIGYVVSNKAIKRAVVQGG